MLINEGVSNSKKSRPELEFPSWKAIIYSFLNQFGKNDNSYQITKKVLEKRLKQMDVVKASIESFHPAQIIETLAEAGGNYLPQDEFDQLLDQLKMTCIAENQFYTVFDMKVGWHTVIDPAIETALGISAKDFSLKVLAGFDPTNPLFHPEDVNHMIRWASISYVLISFPGFNWSALKDYYYVSHRVGTDKCSIDSIRNKKYVTLEKRCYPLYGSEDTEQIKPIYHFDQWSVLDASNFDYVKPRWVTSVEQSEKLNGLFYLFNAYLLDISPKYISILNERNTFDRNKAIANSLNQKIGKFANAKASFDEIQIGNAFSKSIRQKVALTMNTWDKRSEANLVQVDSDQAAVHYAKVLGLLPVPKAVEEIIFQSVL